VQVACRRSLFAYDETTLFFMSTLRTSGLDTVRRTEAPDARLRLQPEISDQGAVRRAAVNILQILIGLLTREKSTASLIQRASIGKHPAL
jgi:hypothetical protein